MAKSFRFDETGALRTAAAESVMAVTQALRAPRH
jgi:hypothetical protein